MHGRFQDGGGAVDDGGERFVILNILTDIEILRYLAETRQLVRRLGYSQPQSCFCHFSLLSSHLLSPPPKDRSCCVGVGDRYLYYGWLLAQLSQRKMIQ